MDAAAQLRAALSDRCDIQREIGAGGMATVYLARDVKHDRDVALKVLHPDLGAAPGGERFLAAIKTTAKLQLPRILPLLDSGSADGLLFYVMPLVDGETLRARLDRQLGIGVLLGDYAPAGAWRAPARVPAAAGLRVSAAPAAWPSVAP